MEASIPDFESLSPLVERVMEALQQEQETLVQLRSHFDAHLEVLPAQQPAALEEATVRVNQDIARLEQLRMQRERQMRLLGRVLRHDGEAVTIDTLKQALRRYPSLAPLADTLGTRQEAVRTAAQHAFGACEKLEFSLEYAVGLGRKMIQAVRNFGETPSSQVYTAKGQSAHTTTPRALVNRIG